MTGESVVSNEECRELALLLQQRFSLQTDTSSLVHQNALTLLHQQLTERLTWLIDHRFETLMQLLYFVDVEEAAVLEVFRTATPAEVPERLAWMVMERQLEKVRSRKMYHFPPE